MSETRGRFWNDMPVKDMGKIVAERLANNALGGEDGSTSKKAPWKLCVLGSANVDHFYNLEDFPAKGQTVMAKSMRILRGGKGANQALQAARMAAPRNSNASIPSNGESEVTFIAMLGDSKIDSMSRILKDTYVSMGISPEGFMEAEGEMTGSAIILRSLASKDNEIVVHSGANGVLRPEDVRRMSHLIEGADALLCQLEVPIESVVEAASIAKSHGVPVILNPAPAQKLPWELVGLVDLLTPNENEVAGIFDLSVPEDDGEAAPSAEAGESPKTFDDEAATSLYRKILASTRDVVEAGEFYELPDLLVTLGEKGVWYRGEVYPPHPLGEVVDTTGAGDSFNGALAAFLGLGMDEAIRRAQVAAKIAIGAEGAQEALPGLDELEKEMARLGKN